MGPADSSWTHHALLGRNFRSAEGGHDVGDCAYEGVLVLECTATFDTSSPISASRTWHDPVVYGTADICFDLGIVGENRPWIDQLGLVQPPVTKGWSDFHEGEGEGPCVKEISVDWTELP